MAYHDYMKTVLSKDEFLATFHRMLLMNTSGTCSNSGWEGWSLGSNFQLCSGTGGRVLTTVSPVSRNHSASSQAHAGMEIPRARGGIEPRKPMSRRLRTRWLQRHWKRLGSSSCWSNQPSPECRNHQILMMENSKTLWKYHLMKKIRKIANRHQRCVSRGMIKEQATLSLEMQMWTWS